MSTMQSAVDKITILLVEDSRVDAEVTMALLINGGDLQVENVSTFADALDALGRRRYDALVLDLNLPDSTGAQSLLALKQHHPSLPIIVLSGNDEEVSVLRSLHYGAEHFLTKESLSQADIRRDVFNAIFRKSLHKPTPQ